MLEIIVKSLNSHLTVIERKNKKKVILANIIQVTLHLREKKFSYGYGSHFDRTSAQSELNLG